MPCCIGMAATDTPGCNASMATSPTRIMATATEPAGLPRSPIQHEMAPMSVLEEIPAGRERPLWAVECRCAVASQRPLVNASWSSDKWASDLHPLKGQPERVRWPSRVIH
jgi:hypothetical protein